MAPMLQHSPTQVQRTFRLRLGTVSIHINSKVRAKLKRTPNPAAIPNPVHWPRSHSRDRPGQAVVIQGVIMVGAMLVIKGIGYGRIVNRDSTGSLLLAARLLNIDFVCCGNLNIHIWCDKWMGADCFLGVELGDINGCHLLPCHFDRAAPLLI